MASEQRESASLPGEIEAWLADHTANIEPGKKEVLARAVESYQLQIENSDTDDVGDIDDPEGLNDLEDLDDVADADTDEVDNPENLDDLDDVTDADTDEVDNSENLDELDDVADTDADADRDEVDNSENLDELDDVADADADADRDEVDNSEDLDDSDSREDTDDELIARISKVESRLDELEGVSVDQRLVELETELDDHVQDLRSRIVDVVKQARTRAPADHHHTDLEESLTEIETDLESHAAQLSDHDSRVDDIDTTVESVTSEVETATAAIDTLESKTESVANDLETTTEAIETLESKADRLAGAVVDLRRRLERVEHHMSHEMVLAELLETAAREGIQKATCQGCDKKVVLSMLAEPACPHCRRVFEDIDAGSGFLSSASLVVADRPALEAGETADKPFEAEDTTTQSHNTNQETQ